MLWEQLKNVSRAVFEGYFKKYTERNFSNWLLNILISVNGFCLNLNLKSLFLLAVSLKICHNTYVASDYNCSGYNAIFKTKC